MNEYDKQAQDFATSCGLTMKCTYLGHYPRLGEYFVSQWSVVLTRPGKDPYVFTFSQSLNDSWKYLDHNSGKIYTFTKGLPVKLHKSHWPKKAERYQVVQYVLYPVKTPPTLYDVLAALCKYCPDTFDEFCDEFGYNNDSIKAQQTYFAVQNEAAQVRRLFGDVIKQLEEIQ